MSHHAPRLLDQLVDLTSIHDLELLEFSLLRTMHGFLQPRALSLLRVNQRGQPLMEITFGDNACTVRREGIDLSPGMKKADRFISATSAPEMVVRDDDGILLVIGLMETPSSRSYLQAHLGQEVSKMDAHLMSGLLQIYRNFCALVHQSQSDQLTGLANRRTFDQCVGKVHELIPPPVAAEETERRRDMPMRYWLVMADIDHFKAINDRFGHLFGDEVLVLLARLMVAAFRADDMLFRFGGEEFVMIIRCADMESARLALERFRSTVSESRFPQLDALTISLGAVEMTRDVFTATLLDYADRALYHSKNEGRNRLTFFEDLLAAGTEQLENVTPGGVSFF